MSKSLVFDKDGVLLDLIETWLPVMQGLAEYTLSLVPADSDRPVSRAMLLSSVGINDDKSIKSVSSLSVKKPL